MNFDNCIDFKINLNVNRKIKVLQITDMQPVDVSQQRFDGRLDNAAYGSEFTDKEKYEKEFYYLKKAIEESNPDLIIVTGDIVYGEFDDNGKNLIEFVEFMDSYKIPWAPVFGNHDNECKLGVTWQCKQFEDSKYCLFKRNTCTGNGNYNIGIFNKDKLLRVIYMIDSNGTWHGKSYGYVKDYPLYNQNERIERNAGIYQDQREYIKNTSKEIDKINKKAVKKSLCCHIPPDFVNKYAFIKGYQTTIDGNNQDTFKLEGTSLIDNKDFGAKGEQLGGFPSNGIYEFLKELSFDTLFVGHEHNNNLSIDCDGIRISYGLKTSTFDYHIDIGYLVFSFEDEETYNIEHTFIEKI